MLWSKKKKIYSIMNGSDAIDERNTSSAMIDFHPHWMKFGDVIGGVSDGFLICLGVYITVVGFVGFLGNSAVVYVICRLISSLMHGRMNGY